MFWASRCGTNARSGQVVIAICMLAQVVRRWIASETVYANLRRRYGYRHLSSVVEHVSKVLRGWSSYFGYGHPRRAFAHVNWFVYERVAIHAQCRSQRGSCPPESRTILHSPVPETEVPAMTLHVLDDDVLFGLPEAGNPHVQWVE